MDQQILLLQQNAVILTMLMRNRKRARTVRRWWVHPINVDRQIHGEFHHLFPQLEADEAKFKNYFRMGKAKFKELLNLLKPSITKESARAVQPTERLAVTLRYLATGNSFTTLSYSFRLGVSTVSAIISETCTAIYDVLQPIYLNVPSTEEEWREISQNFWSMWQMPMCLGALDGKHILLKKPARSGSKYYNYKGTFSTVLLAMCDANYKFLLIDYGSYGHQSDAGIWDECSFRKMLAEQTLGLPNEDLLPNSNTTSPFFIIGDSAFPLGKHLMKPYPNNVAAADMTKRVFNYRLCRARRVIENAFGLLASRFRIFLKQIETGDKMADEIVKAGCALHNFLLSDSVVGQNVDSSPDNEDGAWRRSCRMTDLQPENVRRLRANRANNEAIAVREQLANFFMNEGAVAWQFDENYLAL